MAAIFIATDVNSFLGKSGTEYIVYPSLTTKRFEVFESMQVELENSVSVSAFRVEVAEAYNLFNQMKFADGCNRLHNVIAGAERILNKQPHPILLMCALFICPKEEDQGAWSEAEAQAKIEDWANIDIAFFLASARRLAARFMGGLSTDSRMFSEDQEAQSAE